MRFVLDECIDARLRTIFQHAGHECWTISDAGLSGEDDDEVSVYAHDRGAVLVTDDRNLIRRRRANLFGKTLELRGSKRAALEYVGRHLGAGIELLGSAPDVIVAISSSGAWIIAPAWLATAPPL